MAGDTVASDTATNDYKLIDTDGLHAEPAYDIGVFMREDPVALMSGDPFDLRCWPPRTRSVR